MLDNIKNEIISTTSEYIDSGWERIYAEMEQIFVLDSIARREGILALEDTFDKIENEDLKYFLGLMCDGIASELIEECMENIYRSSPRNGLEGFLYLIDAYGVLIIQSGYSGRMLGDIFRSLVPESRREDVAFKEGDALRERIEK